MRTTRPTHPAAPGKENELAELLESLVEPTRREAGCIRYDLLRGLPGAWIADGACFPTLPAKNLTFTLMANATRIAERFDPAS